jgi:hypothetical protein
MEGAGSTGDFSRGVRNGGRPDEQHRWQILPGLVDVKMDKKKCSCIACIW